MFVCIGALRTGGAALFEPYTDNPETRGFMRIDSDVLKSALTRFMRDGWQTVSQAGIKDPCA